MYRFILGCVILVIVVGAKFAPATQQQDFSKVEIKTQKVAGNVYMLEGSGGNIGVSTGADGLLMIDDQFAPLADKIKAALKSINNSTPKFLLNTHYHGDHTGGNAIFGTETLIVSHSTVRKRLTTANSPKPALPVVTFENAMSVNFNDEEIKLLHMPNGHTDGDVVIYFTKSNVAHLGDDFTPGRFPFVDLSGGGDADGLANNLAEVVRQLPRDVKIIPGHGPVSTIADVKAYQEMIADTVNIVRRQISAGKSLDEIKAAGLPEQYKSLGTGFVKTDAWITTIYNSVIRKK